MRENWPYPPTASEPYGRQAGGWAGRQAGGWAGRQVGGWVGRQAGLGRQVGRQTDKMRVGLKIFKILYRLNYLGFYFLISLLCYYSIRPVYQLVFVN